MNVRVLPEADREALEAALWYEERQYGLGDAFLAERDRALAAIGASPQSAAQLEDYAGPHEIRRLPMRRFPYAVIFDCRSDEVVIVSIAHLHRQPLYWLDRLED